MNAILNRLTDTLNARTETVLAQLAGLDRAITEAITSAERTARERIHAAQIELDRDTAQRLAAFEQSLAEMAADAIGKAAGMVLARVEVLAGLVLEVSQSEQSQKEPEPTELMGIASEPEPASEDALLVTSTIEMKAEQVSTISEAVPLHIAAHMLADSPVGLLPEVEEDASEESPSLEEPPTAEVPNTSDPEGLHTRHSEGRRARYELVLLPVSGETYFQRKGRRWSKVRFTE